MNFRIKIHRATEPELNYIQDARLYLQDTPRSGDTIIIERNGIHATYRVIEVIHFPSEFEQVLNDTILLIERND